MQQAAGETILLVEDDPGVCRLLVRILDDAGYIVLAARLPSEALELWRTRAAEVSAVITDVVMPEMKGTELVRRLRATMPRLRALFVTGYAPSSPDVEATVDPTLEKPFSQETLLRKLRQMLDAP